MRRPILCVDFDGVVHSYTSGWQGPLVISDPYVPGFFKWAIEVTKVFDIAIYSSRTKEPGAVTKMAEWLGTQSVSAIIAGEVSGDFEWPKLFDHISFPVDKPAAFLTIDDRCILFKGDWDNPQLDPIYMINFKPWNK
jgi:hypothetical protein